MADETGMVMMPVELPAPVLPRTPEESADHRLEAVRGKVERKVSRLRAGAAGSEALDLFQAAFGLMQTTTSGPRGVTVSAGLVHAEDWTPIGHVAAKHAAKGAMRIGAMRAELADGRVFEAFTPADDHAVLGLAVDGRTIGCWRAVEMTYEGRFAMPRLRELWTLERRIGVVDCALMGSGCAVLELDPDGGVLVPIRVRNAGIVAGNPWKEVLKATRLGRRLGARAANLDTVLAAQAVWVGEENVELFFVASLAMRTIVTGKAMSSD